MWEWNDAVIVSSRGLRGGSWYDTVYGGSNLQSSNRSFNVCKDRNLLSTAQFTHSTRCLNECGKMVGGWWKAERKKISP